jgi:hypothetical protein
LSPDPKTPAEPRRRVHGFERRRIGRAVTAWAALTLGGLVVLTALTLAYLVRRGRRLRGGLGPAKEVEWPEPGEGP